MRETSEHSDMSSMRNRNVLVREYLINLDGEKWEKGKEGFAEEVPCELGHTDLQCR